MPMLQAAPTVSVVIPTLNAAPFLQELLPTLFAQQPPPLEVVVVDSCSTDNTRAVVAGHAHVQFVTVEKFSHGRARNLGAAHARGDVVAFLSQDAVPASPDWLGQLVAPFGDPTVAATYSRQIPRDDANPMERHFLLTHFPPGRQIRRSKPSGRDLLLADVFFSNVSSAVRRDLLLAHPFDEDLIMGEDQQLSRDLLVAGYSVVYTPDSVVRHSHNSTLGTVFRRYFDSVYSLRLIFPRHRMSTSISMGLPYMLKECACVVRKSPLTLPYYCMYCMARAGGTLASHLAERLPRRWVRLLSLHRYHWGY